ncbi:hypothetical protein GUITHDRAFT_108856 [Guillardia theta CCMP2712]|uniref:Uncharacterized protein n=1 Tax=Guillardia theta (strain CCMP2712) TaxID=905079 RepID=L1JAU8_GUITC|nr:hypothetical protein GUITHDRAFT_108856 [Guillardia theta CCMP2712]EKX45215.1 hypothetical protein GUITHDRAFT_108856 [Guillardia theta CCMP2712]|eukprot:XP_005832195.1 hypothetical protein GUITHDRAFT_108856 [Guillardia theta CCMP2712]
MAGRSAVVAALVLLIMGVEVMRGESRRLKKENAIVVQGTDDPCEWWDAVTGNDEDGSILTTFFHKRYGIALQLYHGSVEQFMAFRFIPNWAWVSKTSNGRAKAQIMYGGGEFEEVDYWFAGRHLEELSRASGAKSMLPDEMLLGMWKGERAGRAMVFQHKSILLNEQDDTFSEPKQLFLVENGFIYNGGSGISISVLYDDDGNLIPLRGVDNLYHMDSHYVYKSAELRQQIIPELIGITPKQCRDSYQLLCDEVKKLAVKLRAQNPFARFFCPQNYRYKGKKEGWVWVGKGSGNMLDGSKPYGE